MYLQIHCFDATTLEMDHTIFTNYISYGSLGVGYGPLAVGARWIAYSGKRIANTSSAVFTSELLSLSSSPSVAQLARESSKQLASGIINLGDRGYKSLSKYCSEVLPNPYIPGLKGIGVANENVPDADSIGMVYSKILLKLFCSQVCCPLVCALNISMVCAGYYHRYHKQTRHSPV